MKFYTLKIARKIQETPDAVSLEFEIPEDLTEVFSFKSGQYLTMRTWINDEEVRRSYSLSTAPFEKRWRVGIKLVPGGLFSTFAHEQLQEGDTLEVAPPMGSFTVKPELVSTHNYVAFAAGSGITPVIGIIKDLLHNDPESHVDLFYGNRKSDSIIFKEELEALKNTYMSRFQLHYVLSREQQSSPLFYGRINDEKCRSFSQYFFKASEIDQYFLCGPHAMIKQLETSLMDLGVDKFHIQFELFTSPLGPLSTQEHRKERVIGKKVADLQITCDGLRMNLEMMSEHDSILDCALAEGVDLPYACKGGVCSTCKAKITQGDVEMMVNYALEPDEVEAGYVLTCQCLPKSDAVHVNFDV